MRSVVLGVVSVLACARMTAAQDAPQDPPPGSEPAPPPVEIAPEIASEPTPPPAPDAERMEQARLEFEAGTAAFERGDLVGALASFETVYALVGTPDVLFNIGVVAEQLGNLHRAIEAFRIFALSAPAADRPEIEERVARLTALRDARFPPAVQEPAPDASERAEASATAGEGRGAARSGGDEAGSSSHGPTFVWTFVGLGVSAAAGLASGLFWVDARAADRELTEMCPVGCSAETVGESRGPTMVTLANAFLVGSLVATAATVAIFLVELGSGGDDEEPVVALGVGPGSVSVRGAW